GTEQILPWPGGQLGASLPEIQRDAEETIVSWVPLPRVAHYLGELVAYLVEFTSFFVIDERYEYILAQNLIFRLILKGSFPQQPNEEIYGSAIDLIDLQRPAGERFRRSVYGSVIGPDVWPIFNDNGEFCDAGHSLLP